MRVWRRLADASDVFTQGDVQTAADACGGILGRDVAAADVKGLLDEIAADGDVFTRRQGRRPVWTSRCTLASVASSSHDTPSTSAEGPSAAFISSQDERNRFDTNTLGRQNLLIGLRTGRTRATSGSPTRPALDIGPVNIHSKSGPIGPVYIHSKGGLGWWCPRAVSRLARTHAFTLAYYSRRGASRSLRFPSPAS